jgi:hypothetical protein
MIKPPVSAGEMPEQKLKAGYDADESGDIAASPDSPTGLEYVKEFVTNLDDTEFAYLQDCVTERFEGKDKPEYKSPESVKETMDVEGSKRSKTDNDEGSEEYVSFEQD